MIFLFPRWGYVSSLEGNIQDPSMFSLSPWVGKACSTWKTTSKCLTSFLQFTAQYGQAPFAPGYIALVSCWVGMAFLEKTGGFVERNQSLLGKGVLARFASIYDFIIHIRNANDVSCFLPMFARNNQLQLQNLDLWAGFWGDEIVKLPLKCQYLIFLGGGREQKQASTTTTN